MSFEYKIHCEDDSGWYIRRKQIGVRGTTEYLHANLKWYKEFDVTESQWGGLWPTREAALVAWGLSGIQEGLDDTYVRPFQVIHADEHTAFSANFIGCTKRDQYVSDRYILGRSSIGWYVARKPYATERTHYLNTKGTFLPTTEGAYYKTKASALGVFRSVEPRQSICLENYFVEKQIDSDVAVEIDIPVVRIGRLDNFYICRKFARTTEYFQTKPEHNWASLADSSSYFKTQEEALSTFRLFQPHVEIEGDIYNPSLDIAKCAIQKGNVNMCQGVIGIYNSFNGHFHWGVGSHTILIEKIWPKASQTAGDKLVRFECNLKNGPGDFTTEGGILDSDTRAEIKNKILDRTGTVDLLLSYIEKHGVWDDAFFNIFHNHYEFYDKVYAPSQSRKDIALATSNLINGVNNLSATIETAYKPIRDESAKKHDEAKNAYFKKLATSLRAAAFASHIEYTAFHAKTIGKVDGDLRVIADIVRLELEVEMARVRCDFTKAYYASQENKEENLAKIRLENVKVIVGLMREYIAKNPDTLRTLWKATLKPIV